MTHSPTVERKRAAPARAPLQASGEGDAERKRFATVQARIALWGGTLIRSERDDGHVEYLVTRWHYTRPFESLEGVEKLLRIAGVPE